MIYFFTTVAGVVLSGLALGYIFNAPIVGAFLGLVVYSAYSSRQLAKLHNWLLAGGKPPESFGPWGQTFEQIYRREKHLKGETRELVLALSRMRRSTNRLRMGVIFLDHQLHIQWWNPAAERLLKLQSQRDSGLNIINLIRDPKFVAFVNGGDFELPLQLSSPTFSGSSLRISISPIDKRDMVMIIEDISQQTKLDQVRSEFVANVSHEMRSPLTVMSGRLEMCESADQVSDRTLDALKMQTDRLMAIVEDLSLLSKLEANSVVTDMPSFDIVPLVSEIADHARALSNGAHNIVASLPAEAVVKGVRSELFSAISNIVFNAVKYSPDGGQIDIQVRVEGDNCLISVKDQGMGVPDEALARLTERFYRVDQARTSGGGSGLGLSIVRHVLARHDTQLMISSKLGEGSTFSFKLSLD